MSDKQQPIFVLGGLSVSDEKWIVTQERIQEVLARGLGTRMGSRFELHANELLSPSGQGPFAGMAREARSDLALELLGLLGELKHSTHYVAIDKGELLSLEAPFGLERPDPYPLAFEAMITRIDWHVKKRLGRSARALLVTDRKDQYERDVSDVVHRRRFEGAKATRVRRVVEFTHPVDSKRNALVQLADLVAFCVKKFLEADLGYKSEMPAAAVAFFARAFELIEDQNPRKSLVPREGRARDHVEALFGSAFVRPKREWRARYLA